MCVISIKEPIRRNSGNLFNDPRIPADWVRIRMIFKRNYWTHKFNCQVFPIQLDRFAIVFKQIICIIVK